MENKQLISSIYKILLLYEDVKDVHSEIKEEDYLAYLSRIYIRFLGRGNSEICDMIKGLISTSMALTHKQIKSSVFHMIELIERNES